MAKQLETCSQQQIQTLLSGQYRKYVSYKSKDTSSYIHVPERSCEISSTGGMSCIAALIFSLISKTAVCHFTSQCLLSKSQSVLTTNNSKDQENKSIKMLILGCKLIYMYVLNESFINKLNSIALL